MKTIWEDIKGQIRSELPKNTFFLWIHPIRFLENDDQTVILNCPNKFSRNWVMENYFDLIQDKLHKAGAARVDLVFKTDRAREEP